MNNETICQSVAEQLSAYLDNELTQQEQQRVYVHLQRCPKCSGLLAEMSSLRVDVKVAELAHGESLDARMLRSLQQDNPSRWLGWLGWGLILAGGFLLGGYILWQVITEIWADSALAGWLRYAILAFYGGFVVLFLSVARQRWITRKTDKYKKVQI